MTNDNVIKKIDPRDFNKLAQAFTLIDQTVDKKYVSNIDHMQVFEPNYGIRGISQENKYKDSKILDIGTNAQLIELTRFVYDDDESIQDKLISVYQAVASYEKAKIFMLIRSSEKGQRIYLGISSDCTSEKGILLDNQLCALESNFIGNFPGTRFKRFENIAGENGKRGKSIKEQKEELLKDVFHKGRNIAAVSGVPSLKSDKKEENRQFVQGIEKVLDSINGKSVDILILAEPVSTKELTNIKNGYQEIYSNISPFSKSVINVSDSVMMILSKL